jgi:hypothetical protein
LRIQLGDHRKIPIHSDAAFKIAVDLFFFTSSPETFLFFDKPRMVFGHDEIVTAQRRVCYIDEFNARVHGVYAYFVKTAISRRYS